MTTIGATLLLSAVAAHQPNLEIHADVLRPLLFAEGPTVLADVPLPDRSVGDLVLRPMPLVSAATRFEVGHARRAFTPDGLPVLFHGHIDGLPESWVYIAASEQGVLGLLDSGSGLKALGPSDGRPGLVSEGLVWQAVSAMMPPPGVDLCGTGSGGRAAASPRSLDAATRLHLELAIETDYEFASLFGNDLDATAAYVVSMQGAVAAIFARDVACDIGLTFVRLWDTPDDLFNQDDPLQPFRNHWNDVMADVPRDLAQFLSGRVDLPYGGVAWLNATCGGHGYSVAGYMLGSFVSGTEPAFGNWDVTVAAHELGHNCGTGHTHDYSIDDCASGEIVRGSIMSYCHTTTGGGANLDMRFHAITTDAMRGHLEASECLDIDCNGNGVADAVDIDSGSSLDSNLDGVPDDCQDCNENGQLDGIDIANGVSADIDADGMPDECQPDCNANGAPDQYDIGTGFSQDQWGDGVPDECQPDCNGDGVADYNQIQDDMSLDLDRNVQIDSCEDCDGDGTPDLAQLGGGLNIWLLSSGTGGVVAMHPLTGVPMVSGPEHIVESPGDLVVLENGRVLVTDVAANRIVEIDVSTGDVIGDFVLPGTFGLDAPRCVLEMADDLLVACEGSGAVLRFDRETGDALSPLVAPGGVESPQRLLVGVNGELLIGLQSGAIRRHDPQSGAFLGTLVESGIVSDLRGLLRHPDGMLLVSDAQSDSIQAFSETTGLHLGRWDTGGLAAGYWQLLDPGPLLIGPGGHVLVVSTASNTALQRYHIGTGLFQRSFYILDQLSPATVAFDVMPASSEDCNANMRIDTCEIASGEVEDVNSNGVPDSCECIGDLDGDGLVGVDDILTIISSWGGPGGDADGDGVTGTDDLLIVLSMWGSC